MNLRIKITTGFLLVVFVMTIVAGVIIWQQTKMQIAFQNSCLTSELERSLLECRRQEKNYLLRNDEEAIGLFQAHFDTLFTLATNLSTTINENHLNSELQDLKDKLTNYQKEFERSVLYYDVENYQREFEINEHLCVISARECHRIINRIKTITEDQFNNALSISSIVNIFSVLIGLFLSVMISSFITDKIMDLLGTPDGYLINVYNQKKEKALKRRQNEIL